MAQILANLQNKNIFFCLEAKIMLSLCSSFHQEKVPKNLLNIALRVEEIFLFTVCWGKLIKKKKLGERQKDDTQT